MSRRCNLRCASDVRRCLQASEDPLLALDEPSDDDYDDSEEAQSGSESEEDKNEGLHQLKNEPESHGESEEEILPDNNESPARKRLRKAGDEEFGQSGRRRSLIIGQNGYRWYKRSQNESQDRRNSPSDYSSRPIGKPTNTPLEAWNLLLRESILQKIQIHTNEEIRRFRESMETEAVLAATYADVDLQELRAFFGLMYFSGLYKTSRTSLDDLWSNEYGLTLYRAAMPQKRFKFLLRTLRFDDKLTRIERREIDKFAPIREIWDEFLANCTKNYNPDTLCVANEQILDFRGRCPFKVKRFRSKQDECGLKIVMLNDSRTCYMFNALPYLGKITTQDNDGAPYFERVIIKDEAAPYSERVTTDDNYAAPYPARVFTRDNEAPPYSNLVTTKYGEAAPLYYMKKLSQPIHGTNRNITCDNWFTSVDLFDQMLRDHSITMVGTMRKSRLEIPESFRGAGEVGTAKYAFDATKTLLSYTHERNKVSILLSTFHHKPDIDQQTKKPEILTFYENTRGATSIFDEMCIEYTTARKTLRWPMRVWMGILDQARINAMILYYFNATNVSLSRKDFLKSLIMGLLEPHLRSRLNFPRLRRDLRLSIQMILKIDAGNGELPKSGSADKIRARCRFCPRSQDRKVRVFCDNCRRPVCEDHKTVLCLICSVQG